MRISIFYLKNFLNKVGNPNEVLSQTTKLD